jgi:hypothetical protein
MGFENEVERSFGRPCRSLSAGPSGHANSPHPSSREGRHSTAWWNSKYPPIAFDPERTYTAAASLVNLNSLPSVQMRCIMTAKRRASATIAFFIPRCLAVFIAQALSHDHFVKQAFRRLRLMSALPPILLQKSSLLVDRDWHVR